MPSQNISAIILAGGQGRRMQNRDKGLLQWRGRRLIEHCIARIESQVDDIVLSCNRNLTSYERCGYPVVQDQLADFQGPLAGIHAALAVCNENLIFVCPCDCPLLPSDVVERLWRALQQEKTEIAIAHDGKRAQSLVMLLRKSCTSELEQHLLSGARSVQRWQQQQRFCYVDFSSQSDAFANFNSNAELKRMR
ncbi:MAG: molybdenum cofactor guanylyltransferase MobA [Pseudomonadales bacterium]